MTSALVPLQRTPPAPSAALRGEPVGRLPTYSLRISLLEQCQLRCLYCMPGSVRPYTPNERWLRAAQHARLAPLFERVGVTKLRFTGGEPLLRADVSDVVAAWRASMPNADLALTTNGQRLLQSLDGLVAAGLDRVTVHLDTLQPERYLGLMGDGHPDQILEGIVEANRRLREVKINVVVQKGRNEDELPHFLDLSARLGVEVRFIELMNTGSARTHVEETFVSGADILARIQTDYRVCMRPRRRESDPAMLFEAYAKERKDSPSVVFGLIASDTQPFCSHCDRLRLSAEGSLRGCLYAPSGIDVGRLLRDGASDDEVTKTIERGLDAKRSHHPLVGTALEPFSMADVGG